MKSKVVALVGTNASGKSALALDLAQTYSGEIISADSRHVYRGLDIATGKVTSDEQRRIPHHCIDIADPRERYTAADFVRDGRNALRGIWQRDHLPFVVGGTGFYIDALLGRVALGAVPPNEALRDELDAVPAHGLFERLNTIDPARAADLARKGEHTLHRRIVRALEIATAPQTSEAALHLPAGVSILWIGIALTDAELKARIRQRTTERLSRGMIDEARHLHVHGLSYARMEELGLEYKHLAHFLRGEIDEQELRECIERDDWKYAKRQRTWFKRNEAIEWFTPAQIQEIDARIREFLA